MTPPSTRDVFSAEAWFAASMPTPHESRVGFLPPECRATLERLDPDLLREFEEVAGKILRFGITTPR